ncbi:hypothetical protein HK102_008749, partial [Quaeritorhiza haematococci]
YPKFTGERLEGQQLSVLVDGLEGNGMLAEYSHILTGYVGRASSLSAVANLVEKVRSVNPRVLFVLDPVMGDDSKLYVPQDSVPIYRDRLCRLADIATPNAFEAEVLTGIKVNTTEAALRALSAIHDLGVPNVVITSSDLIDDEAKQNSSTPSGPGQLHLFASQRYPTSNNSIQQTLTISFPKLPGIFTGTGDLFASVLLAQLATWKPENSNGSSNGSKGENTKRHISFDQLQWACERAVGTLQGVLQQTLETYRAKQRHADGGVEKGEGATFMRCHELSIIQCKKLIEEPPVLYQARALGQS